LSSVTGFRYFSRRSWVKLLLFCALFLSLTQTSWADIIDLSQIEAAPLGLHSSYFIEQDKLSLEQALTLYQQQQFKPSKQRVLTFGIAAAPTWLGVTINNDNSENSQRRLVIDNSWMDNIEIAAFHHASGKTTQYQMGDQYPFSQRPFITRNFEASIDFPPGQTDLLIRFATPDPMVIPLYLLSTDQQQTRQSAEQYSYGLIYGYILALMLYNAMLYIGLREKIYLAYSSLMLIFLVANMGYTGHGFMFLWPEYPQVQQWIQPFLLLLVCSLGLTFGLLFLNIKRYSRRMVKAVSIHIVSSMSLFALCVVLSLQGIALLLAFSYVTVYILMIFGMGIFALKRHIPHAIYFVFAVSAGSLGIMLTAISTWGFIPFNPWLFRAAEIGMLIEASLLALALSSRIRGIQAQKALVEKLADTDPLTQLNNRRGFFKSTEKAWSNSLRHGRTGSIIIFDLDNFKKLNDKYGHDGGDEVLCQIGRLIIDCIRKGDVASRWGGEEFVLYLPETDIEKARQLAERLRLTIMQHPVVYQSQKINVTASFGVAEQMKDDLSIEPIVGLADTALYQAKTMGRNRVNCAEQQPLEQSIQVG
jgi:diguanylate cyclase (GGDEF)-like protein